MTDEPVPDGDRRAPASRRRDWGWALVLGLLAIGWSEVRIGVPSLWADEGATLSAVQRGWPDLWRMLGNIDAVHGLYYALLKLWFAVVPISAVTLRLPSLLAVGALVALTHLLAGRWFGRGHVRGSGSGWAVLAAALVAVLPRTTWMAIEGRSWALGSLLVLGATLALVAWRRSGRWFALAGHAVLMAVAIALNIHAVFLLVAHGITLVLLGTGRRRLLTWLAAATVAAALASPVVVVAAGQRGQLGERTPPGAADFVRDVVVKQFALGDTPGDSPTWVPASVWTASAVALAGLCWVLVLVAVVSSAVAGLGAVGRRLPEVLSWTIPWLLVPPALVLVASLVTGTTLYHPRYFSFSLPAFAIAVVAGLRALPSSGWWPRVRVALVMVLVTCTVPVWLSQRDVTSKGGYDWSRASSVVGAGARPGDGVYFGTSPAVRVVTSAYPATFAGLRDFARLQTPAQEGSLDGESAPLDFRVVQGAPARVWAVWSDRDTRRVADTAVFTAAGYRVSDEWEGTETIVVLLER